jgi:hypothetical protein
VSSSLSSPSPSPPVVEGFASLAITYVVSQRVHAWPVTLAAELTRSHIDGTKHIMPVANDGRNSYDSDNVSSFDQLIWMLKTMAYLQCRQTKSTASVPMPPFEMPQQH